jgi:SAM-dependent methyltransferase
MCEECQNRQEEYDIWSLNTQINQIQRLNAPTLNNVEIGIIESINPKNLLDIGCGNGKRLFSFLRENQINFTGIEKFERLYAGSPYSNKISNCDISNPNFSIKNFNNIDTISILGGSLFGILCLNCQKNAWKNITNVLLIGGYIIFDTPILNGFETNESIGERSIMSGIPPQFFLSRTELEQIWKENNLTIINTQDHTIPGITLRYYLLQKN